MDVDHFLAYGYRQSIKPANPMATVLLLLVSALLCFAFFYKAIEWFEKI